MRVCTILQGIFVTLIQRLNSCGVLHLVVVGGRHMNKIILKVYLIFYSEAGEFHSKFYRSPLCLQQSCMLLYAIV